MNRMMKYKSYREMIKRDSAWTERVLKNNKHVMYGYILAKYNETIKGYKHAR